MSTMDRNTFIKELKSLVRSGGILTFKQAQENTMSSRSKIDGEINRNVYEKVKIGGIYILIKK